MAIIKVRRPINVEDIYVGITCPVCEGYVRMKMKGSRTRKNCPLCNKVTYFFGIEPSRGFIVLNMVYTGPDNVPTEYNIDPNDVEVDDGPE